MTTVPDYIFEFQSEDKPYRAKVWHYSGLTDQERVEHGITENCFLVYLNGSYEYKPFELFVGEDLEWHTKSSFVVDDEIVQQIGLLIHNESV